MIRTSFRTTLFRNHRCTKEQNENKGNNNSNQGRVTRYNDSTGISRCDFSQKCAESKGIQVRTKRDKCVSATKTKKVRTNDNNNNNKQELRSCDFGGNSHEVDCSN